MDLKLKKRLTASASAIALVLGLGSVAWACTEQNLISHVQPRRTTVNSPVTISGQAPSYAAEPVEIRWNGVQGPTLAKAVTNQAGSFSTTINVPDVTPGVYYVLLVGRNNSGVARAALNVTSGVTSGTSSPLHDDSTNSNAQLADLWSGFSEPSNEMQTSSSTPSQIPSSGGSGAAGIALVLSAALALSGGIAIVALRGKRRRKVLN